MIVKTDKGYQVRSEDGKKALSADNLSKELAQKRLKEVEMFKHMDKGLYVELNKGGFGSGRYHHKKKFRVFSRTYDQEEFHHVEFDKEKEAHEYAEKLKKLGHRDIEVSSDTNKAGEGQVNVIKKAWSPSAREAAMIARRKAMKGPVSYSAKHHHVEYHEGEEHPYAVFRTHDRSLWGTSKDIHGAKAMAETADVFKAMDIDIEKGRGGARARGHLIPKIVTVTRGGKTFRMTVYFNADDVTRQHLNDMKERMGDTHHVYIEEEKFSPHATSSTGQPMKPAKLFVAKPKR